MNTRSSAGGFDFKGGDQRKKVGLLSGGERNRVHLAKTLAEGGDLILLDEPTNDLEARPCRTWRRPWKASPAAPSASPATGGSSTKGDLEAYEEGKKRRLGADSLITKRIKHQQFARG